MLQDNILAVSTVVESRGSSPCTVSVSIGSPVSCSSRSFALRPQTIAIGLVLVLAPSLAGQSISSGTVRGTVNDSTGHPLGDVRVAISDSRSGASMVLRTPRNGAYAFGFLPPGEYDLLAERLGFLPVEVRSIVVRAGGEADVNVVLAPVEPPVMERSVTTFGNRLDRSAAGPGWQLGGFELRRLPDERRDLASAARFSSFADDALTIEGLPASYSQLTVDGIPFQLVQHPLLGQTQAADFGFPLTAFSEATIDPGGLDVEWSGFTSGRVSAVGPRGTNRLESRFYADWAPTALTSSKYFHPSRLSGNSFRGGWVVSGPIIRDTAHFVLGIDAQRLQTPLPPAWEPNAADAGLLTVADSLGVNVAPYQAPSLATVRLASGFGRFDWQANQSNRLSFLALGSRLDSDNPSLGGDRAVGLGTKQKSWDLGLGATLTNVLSPVVALELRLGFEIGRQEYFGTDTALTVTTDGPAAWGTDPALPSRNQRSEVRASEAIHFTAGRHRVKLGGGGRFASHDDTFGFGRGGVFAFGGVDQLAAVDGEFMQTVGRDPLARFHTSEFGWFLQDRWVVAPGAEWVFGFRMDWERLGRNALVRNADLFALTGILTDSVNATALKLSPRAGFNWDVGNKHRWVVSADGGLYQGSINSGALAEAVAEAAGGRELRAGTGTLGSWPAVPDSVVAPPQGALVSVLPMGFTAPRSTKAAFGVTGALGGGTALHLAGSYRHTQFLVRRRDLNRVPGAAGRDQYGRPIYGTLEQHGSALFATPGSGRRFDEYSIVSALDQDGVSDYIGVTARLERRVGRRLLLSLGYTYSQTKDNLPGLALGPDAQLSPFPDSLNGRQWEDGVSDFDVPHRLVFGAELGFSAFRLAGFYGFRSGRPFTPGFRDGVDANGDGSWRNDPAYVDDNVAGVTDLFTNWDCLRTQVGAFAARNSCRGPTQQTLDLRLVIGPFHVGYPLELVVDGMNLLDTEFADVDRALYLVDPTGSLSQDPATGVVTVPLVVNPDFGKPVHRYGSGRYLRIGLRLNYE
jgi:Carboxypeptidase regulatory-like domain